MSFIVPTKYVNIMSSHGYTHMSLKQKRIASMGRSSSTIKKMVATFISKSGHVATIALEDRRTIKTDWYISDCLPNVVAELLKNNPKP